MPVPNRLPATRRPGRTPAPARRRTAMTLACCGQGLLAGLLATGLPAAHAQADVELRLTVDADRPDRLGRLPSGALPADRFRLPLSPSLHTLTRYQTQGATVIARMEDDDDIEQPATLPLREAARPVALPPEVLARMRWTLHRSALRRCEVTPAGPLVETRAQLRIAGHHADATGRYDYEMVIESSASKAESDRPAACYEPITALRHVALLASPDAAWRETVTRQAAGLPRRTLDARQGHVAGGAVRGHRPEDLAI